jgi:hypothetical protein
MEVAGDVQKEWDMDGVGALVLSFNHALLISKLMTSGVLYSSAKCSCGLDMNLSEFSRALDEYCWRCPSKTCKKRKSIRDGSYFEKQKFRLVEFSG